jgi:predicted amino acid racemase
VIYNRVRIVYGVKEVILTPYGRSFEVGEEYIERSERAANGEMRRDITAIKKTFTLSYDLVDGEMLKTLEALKAHGDTMILHLETQDGDDPYTVLMRSYNRKRVIARGGGLWSGVVVEFVEV